MAVLANDSQTFVEETSVTRALHDCAQLAHVQPHALATGTDVNLHGAAGFRGQLLAAFRTMHPVRVLHPLLLGGRLGLLLL